MIARYTPKEIGLVWTDKAKFQTWLAVELAMIQARCNLGLYESSIASLVKEALCPEEFMTDETVAAIHERDREIEHDLQAFVDIVRSRLPLELQRFIHDEMTSYDTEVPALALQFRRAGAIIIYDLSVLIDALRLSASEHQWTYCMGITHGQDAKPTTFGWRLCAYLEMMEGACGSLQNALGKITAIKCSGAVGNYETISPELESEVCRILGLKVRPAATQIVARDVFADVLSQLAILGGGIEKMSTDLRLLATSAYGEIREPRKEKQKGSSAMPHKRNPILLERMSGMAIALRGYAVMGQELIRTWLERDIAHSSVERIAFPDATILVDYMIQKMTWVIANMEVNRERMAAGIERSYGCWASEEAKLLLEKAGVSPENAYRFVQKCAFAAFDQKRPFREVFTETELPPRYDNQSCIISETELNDCFGFAGKLIKNLPWAYRRMGLYSTAALEPNIPNNKEE